MKNNFRLKDIVYENVQTYLRIEQKMNEIYLYPEVYASISEEKLKEISKKYDDDDDMEDLDFVFLLIDEGFNTHCSSFEELKGKKFIWQDISNKDNESSGSICAGDHGSIYDSTIEILDITEEKIIFKWTGFGEVNWNEDYDGYVPFEALCEPESDIKKIPIKEQIKKSSQKDQLYFLDTTKSDTIKIDNNTEIKFKHIPFFKEDIKKLLEKEEKRQLITVAFDLIYNNEVYSGTIVVYLVKYDLNDPKQNDYKKETVIPQNCPKEITFIGFDDTTPGYILKFMIK